jgi:hypothetical protein
MNIWLPNSVNYDAYKVDRAVNEYDERLMFGRNEDTGDWCVFIRLPGDRPPYPVMGFQHIPESHEVIARLSEGDTRKHSERIYREIVESEKKRRAELEYVSDQAAADAAERTEHMMRKRGASPVIKVFVGDKGGE